MCPAVFYVMLCCVPSSIKGVMFVLHCHSYRTSPNSAPHHDLADHPLYVLSCLVASSIALVVTMCSQWYATQMG